jgi:hypothetical protein
VRAPEGRGGEDCFARLRCRQTTADRFLLLQLLPPRRPTDRHSFEVQPPLEATSDGILGMRWPHRSV